MKNLTAKQLAFANHILDGMDNNAEAYRLAYNKRSCSIAQARTEGYRLRNHPWVEAYVREEQQRRRDSGATSPSPSRSPIRSPIHPPRQDPNLSPTDGKGTVRDAEPRGHPEVVHVNGGSLPPPTSEGGGQFVVGRRLRLFPGSAISGGLRL